MEDYDSLGARQQPYDVPENECEDTKQTYIEESMTDYFGNQIHDDDGVFIIKYNRPIYSDRDLLIGFKEMSAITTHDTITNFLEDETDNYLTINFLGLGDKYKKEGNSK